MEKINIKTKEELNSLYDSNAIVAIGIVEESAADFYDWLKNDCEVKFKDDKVYVFTGRSMNEAYTLTGDNAYKSDLTFIAVSFDSIKNQGKLPVKRLELASFVKWFDDIVDNNRLRGEG